MPILVAALALLLHVYVEVSTRFEGTLWQLPSRLYSDRLVLRPGQPVPASSLVHRLERAGYTRTPGPPERPGQYRLRGQRLDVYRRAFDAPEGSRRAARLGVEVRDGRVVTVRDGDGRRLREAVLEPVPLATVFGSQQEEREVVGLDEVPERLVQAVLAAEDARFYSHHGLDPRGIARAVLANLRSGRIVQGGSTITQQTVKNLYLGTEQTWWRKAREAVMAAVLDWRYSKDRILEVYLNEVYLGQRGSVAICGVQAASRFYLGRDVADLTLGESALLAGLIRNPGGYNPFRHPDRALERRNLVLDAMQRLGQVDETEAARAREETLRLASGAVGHSQAPYVVDFVRTQLAELYPSDDLSAQGLNIFTTVDPFLQMAAEGAIEDGLRRLERTSSLVRQQKDERTLQGLLLAMRPATGEILAMVGGRDYAASQFNRAAQAKRQPGSCFKPFVYLTAFATGGAGGEPFTPATMLQDEPFTLKQAGDIWSPVNYDGEFRGSVTARVALEDSLNVPTVRAAMETGLDEVARMAERCGFRGRFRSLPSLALGAQEVTPLELATAYATLFNLGRRASPLIIHEVADADGRRLERREVALREAVSPQAAYLVTDILRGVMTRGTGASSSRLGFHGIAAGKTGTTDDTRDSWFVGATPDLLALVWVGYDDNARTGLTGASGALPIWVDFMQRAGLAGSRTPFRIPDGLVWRSIDPDTGMLAVGTCPRRNVEVFAEGAEPRRRCSEHGPGFFRRMFRRFRRDV